VKDALVQFALDAFGLRQRGPELIKFGGSVHVFLAAKPY
jgi:hypothetical protein